MMRAKPLILVVDDEPNFIEIASAKLQAAGFEVIAAENEAQALLKCQDAVPDLVLMDIHMPGATGTDAALAIKQNPKTKDVKVAFLTNLQDPWPAIKGDEKSISLELGMEDFLRKTDDLNQLVERVWQLVQKNGVPTDAPGFLSSPTPPPPPSV